MQKVPGYLLFVSSLLLLWATPTQATQLKTWRFNASQNQFEFTTDDSVQPQAQLVSDPTRLVIDLPGVTFGRSQIQESLSGGILSVRIGQFNRDTTRLVIELAPGYTLDPNQIRFRGITARQWVVQLPAPRTASGAVVIPSVSSPPATLTSASGTRGQAVPQFSRLSQPKSANLAQALPANTAPPATAPNPIALPTLQMPGAATGRLLVVIDPGHGGPDPGAVGIAGLKETDIVLDIGRQVTSLLQQQGVSVLITRNGEYDLDLEPRVQMAERANATVFVSIHANSIDLSRTDVSGLETYYYQSGRELAQFIHQSILQATGIPDRGVRTARFYVLRKTTMPSVLVEVGFVTGQDDAARLSNPSYRTQMASAIARGILQYLQRTARF